MRRKTTITIPHLAVKTVITIPAIVTGLLLHAGEYILKKPIPFLSNENQDDIASELSDKGTYFGTDTKVTADADTVFGMRPFGPKIYIRK